MLARRTWETLQCAEDTPLSEFFAEFERVEKEYRAAGGVFEQQDRIDRILAMPKSYDNVVTVIETMESTIAFDTVKARLLDEELKTKLKSNSKENSTVSDSAGAAAFNIENRKKNFNRGGRNNNRNGQNNCFENNNFRSHRDDNNGNYRPRCYNCGDFGHKSYECDKPRNSQVNVVAQDTNDRSFTFLSFSGSALPALTDGVVKFVVDSGCTDHLVNDVNLLTHVKKLSTPLNLNVAEEGTTMVIEYGGNLPVAALVNGREMNGMLHGVLLAPNVRFNLLSVSRIEESGGEVKFCDGKALILLNGELVAEGERTGRLYWVKFRTRKAESNVACIASGEVSQLWHRRLGHLSMNNLMKLKSMSTGIDQPLTSTIDFCETCTRTKLTRQPFSDHGDRAQRPLRRVHTDVGGPTNPTSFDGYQYFISFLDDYTHMSVIYLMKYRNEVLDCFKKYHAMATAHFGRQLSRLRCDNGGEYTSNAF